jgi:DNA-binding response OmpR family regulator
VRILLVDDEADFVLFAKAGLESAHVHVETAATGGEAQETLMNAGSGHFDIILLDIGLPGASGLDLLYDLRQAGDETPVIIVSGESRTKQKVKGLTLGADDYIVKPPEIEELVARMEAVVRRREAMQPMEYGEVSLDLARRRVARSGRRVELSPREFDLLLALVRAKGELVSREALLRDVWDMNFDPGTNVVDVHVGRLRRKIDAVGRPLIQNKRGKGYRILESAETAE